LVKLRGVIVLIDEIHTPDSSLYSEGYQERQDKGERRRAKQLSKEVSSLVDSKWFQGLEGQSIPDMSDEYIETVSEDILNCMKKSLVKNSLELTFQISMNR
jgi:phosphoribosylaminoimidazole-succinocarboxamide synthase